MSGSSTPTGGRPAKAMSSRLMTMKFMQRGSVASPNSPNTPSPSTPDSSKRQKIEHTPTSATAPQFSPGAQSVAIRGALAAEESKRSAALEKLSVGSGETKWVFSCFDDDSKTELEGPKIVSYGEEFGGSLDDQYLDQPEPWSSEQGGRMKFGLQNTAKEPTEQDSDDSENNSDSNNPESVSDPELPPDPERAARLRHRFEEKKKAQAAEREKLATQRRKKDVNLNKHKSGSGIRKKR